MCPDVNQYGQPHGKSTALKTYNIQEDFLNSEEWIKSSIGNLGDEIYDEITFSTWEALSFISLKTIR